MATAGYVRVSTPDQDSERQMNTIRDDYDVDQWFADVEHGDVLTNRGGLDDLRARADEFDRVVVDELSRLGRTIEVRDVVDELREQDVDVEILDKGLTITDRDEMDFASRITWMLLIELAEEELKQLRRRTREGVRLAQEAGKHVGNPPRGYNVEDGFLRPNEDYEIISQFIHEVNKGRPKAPTARFFGIDPSSYQSILENSHKYWDATYIGDRQWRQRRDELRHDERDLLPLEEKYGGEIDV